MKKLLKRIAHPLYKRYHFWYHKKPRKYTYKGIYTIVQPSVFSPKNTVSTKVFLDYLDTLNLKNKHVLELGCGSGIISIFLASQGAKVTASDINQKALDALIEVSKAQNFEINCIYSNLFDTINSAFDFIFINPPYYPKKPKNIEEKAWFCGSDFEYFKELFLQLSTIVTKNVTILMILSDACDLDIISNIAKNNHLVLHKTHEKKMAFEINYIFQIIEASV